MKLDQSDLEAHLEQSLARHRVPGASIAVFHRGEWVRAAAGLTNLTTGVELTPDTVMHIGSITKVLNATLVMQLVDDGAVDLDERVLRYLPELRLKDTGALNEITVRMLLNHTSGIDGESQPDRGHDEETIEKGVVRMACLAQLFRPGAEFSYCNAATVIAGYLAQRLREKSWYRLIRERIFAPLQMEHSATLPEEALLHRASVGHLIDPRTQQVVRTSFAFLPLGWAPCGMTLMVSARDLVQFATAHIAWGVGANGARILSPESARAMQQMGVSNHGKHHIYPDGMGLGWMVSDDGLLHHSGGGPGVLSVLYAHPERQWAAAILTNARHGFGLVDDFMQPWLEALGLRNPSGTTEIRPPANALDVDARKFAGVFEDVVSRFIVSSTPEGLTLRRQSKFVRDYPDASTAVTEHERLIPLGEDQFLVNWGGRVDLPDAYRIFTFKRPDASGRMRYIGTGARLYLRVS
jgi:CubicO group peptidase (beta-lactamase class C family)